MTTDTSLAEAIREAIACYLHDAADPEMVAWITSRLEMWQRDQVCHRCHGAMHAPRDTTKDALRHRIRELTADRDAWKLEADRLAEALIGEHGRAEKLCAELAQCRRDRDHAAKAAAREAGHAVLAKGRAEQLDGELKAAAVWTGGTARDEATGAVTVQCRTDAGRRLDVELDAEHAEALALMLLGGEGDVLENALAERNRFQAAWQSARRRAMSWRQVGPEDLLSLFFADWFAMGADEQAQHTARMRAALDDLGRRPREQRNDGVLAENTSAALRCTCGYGVDDLTLDQAIRFAYDHEFDTDESEHDVTVTSGGVEICWGAYLTVSTLPDGAGIDIRPPAGEQLRDQEDDDDA